MGRVICVQLLLQGFPVGSIKGNSFHWNSLFRVDNEVTPFCPTYTHLALHLSIVCMILFQFTLSIDSLTKEIWVLAGIYWGDLIWNFVSGHFASASPKWSWHPKSTTLPSGEHSTKGISRLMRSIANLSWFLCPSEMFLLSLNWLELSDARHLRLAFQNLPRAGSFRLSWNTASFQATFPIHRSGISHLRWQETHDHLVLHSKTLPFFSCKFHLDQDQLAFYPFHFQYSLSLPLSESPRHLVLCEYHTRIFIRSSTRRRHIFCFVICAWPTKPRFQTFESRPFRAAAIYEYGVCYITVSPSGIQLIGLTYFLKLCADQSLVFNWSRARVPFLRWNSVCFLLMAKVELLEKDIS